jgi:coenzyme F420-reducing hydrogenase gamma subunit
MSKPKIAIFDFAGCEGDQLQIINLEEKILEILEHADIVTWREGMSEETDDYDIALIEGSCTRKSDEERLRKIRKNAKLVVALGSCATIGGINCLRNYQDQDQVRKYVYGDKADWYETYEARPIDAVIPVDHYIPQCPINQKEFLYVMKCLLTGQTPDICNNPVCVECKLAGNICVFEKGEFCVGPVTRGGCEACCIREGSICWGCRGPVNDPNTDSHREVLEKYGLSVEQALGKFKLYFGWTNRKND